MVASAEPVDDDAAYARQLHQEHTDAEIHAAEARRRDEEASLELVRRLHEQELAEVAAAERREREAAEAAAASRRAEEEAASEALVRELQEQEDAAHARSLWAESQSAAPAHAPAAAPSAARSADEAEIRFRLFQSSQPPAEEPLHLFRPSMRITGGGGDADVAAARVPGRSYASAAADAAGWPRQVHASAPAPAIALPLPRRPAYGGGAVRPQIVIDGANVGWQYGAANGGGGFCARGVVRCVEYWCGRQVRRGAVAVVLHSRYWRDDCADLARLEAMGVLCCSPAGHDDDLFMLQYAQDGDDAWLVSNDTYANHREVMGRGLRKRLIAYMWAGFGSPKDTFSPKAGPWSQRFPEAHGQR